MTTAPEISTAAPNSFVRNFLIVAGFIFGATGLTFMIAPALVPAVAGSPSPTPDAINDARAIYGAMELAFGAFLGFAGLRPRLYEGGLWLAIFVGGFAAVSRFVGLALIPETPLAHAAYGALDLVGALVAWVGLRRLPGGTS